MTDSTFDKLFPEIAPYIKHGLLHGVEKVEMPVRTEDLFEHSTDNLDLDMSVGEHLLAQRHPLEYDLHVNGIRRIVVRDEGHEYRYSVVDGQVISQGKF